MLEFLGRRTAHWHTVLQLYAFEIAAPDQLEPADGRLRLRAIRLPSHGNPHSTIDVREIWRSGRDRQRLMPTNEGHHLLRASWHAQIGGAGAERAERLDVERFKPADLMRHRHPLGSPNHVREQTAIATPEAWLLHVETVIFQCSPKDEAD